MPNDDDDVSVNLSMGEEGANPSEPFHDEEEEATDSPIHVSICEMCGNEVSGPNYDAVEETQARHIRSVHPPVVQTQQPAKVEEPKPEPEPDSTPEPKGKKS